MNTFSAVAAERSRPYRIVGVAAVLMAAVAVGVMFVANANRPQPTGALPVGATTGTSPSPEASPASSPEASPASSPEASPASSPAPSAVPSPSSAPATNEAPFICGSSTLTAKQSPPAAFVDAIRTGSHAGYDRVTVEFSNGQPGSVTIRPQAGTTFTQSPSGQPVKLAGTNGILVIIRGSDAHTAYVGVRDIKTTFPGLVEVRVLEDFEGQVALGLGVSETACYRASVLTNPVRVVIDAQVN
jgi:hypothetical protein